MEARLEVDQRTERVILVSTVLVLAAGVVASAALDRAYRRWWHENNPFADARRSVERARSGYRAKRDTSQEVGEVVGAIIGGVIGAWIGDEAP
jgi:hypothetical protein